jgi:hypothetical protein
MSAGFDRNEKTTVVIRQRVMSIASDAAAWR